VIGTVVSAISSERLAGVVLTSDQLREQFITDQNGIFRLYTTYSKLNVIAYHSDYQLLSLTIEPALHNQLNVTMNPVIELNTIEVNKKDSIRLSLKTFEELHPSNSLLPTMGGETDALNNLKMLPGISNVSFGNQGLSVRGGSPDQNNTFVDGIPVYNTFHLLGLFSIFNANSINNIKLHKDVMPTKYSNRLSSVIDIGLNNGNKKKSEVEADIGILSSGISVNGPILKDKLSYSFSARRTYADLIGIPLQRLSDRNNDLKRVNRLWSYDIFGKVHWQINNNNQLSFAVYNGGDQLNFETKHQLNDEQKTIEKTKGGLGWRNNLIGVKYQSVLNSRIQAHFELSRSSYAISFLDEYSLTQTDGEILNAVTYSNGLTDNRGAIDIDITVNKRNIMKVGIGALFNSFNPYEQRYTVVSDKNSFESVRQISGQNSVEEYAYIENKTYFNGGNLSYGIRAARFRVSEASYTRFQPSLQLVQNISKTDQLRFSLSTASQFIHLLPNNNLGLPLDIWLPVSNTIKPMSVTQLSSKYVLKRSKIEASIGVFSKQYSNLIEYRNGGQLSLADDFSSNIVSGLGRAYGVETAMRYTQQNYNVYLAYTYSRSLRTVQSINDNIEYFSKYDRPHELNLLGDMSLSDNDKLIVSFTLASGNPITLPNSRYVSLINGEKVIVEEYSDINNYRLPVVHHLDISYSRERKHLNHISKLIVGVYNIYNQHNTFMVFIGLNEKAEPVLKSRSYLPILPMVKYSIQL
jgi:hypothetical protein